MSRARRWVRPSGAALFAGGWLVGYAALVGIIRDPASLQLLFNSAWMAFRITAAIALHLAARASTDPSIAKAWRLLFFSQLLAVVSNLNWVISDLTGWEIADLAWFATSAPETVLSLWGFWAMMRSGEVGASRRSDWIDAAVFIVACSTIAWYFIVASEVTKAYESVSGLLLFVFNTSANEAVLVFAVAAWVRSPRGVAAAALPWTVAGLAMLLAGDVAVELEMLRDAYVAGSPVDVWYGAAILCLILGADAQRRDPSGVTAPPPTLAHTAALVVGALAGSLMPMIAEIVTGYASATAFAVSASGVIVLMALVLWRDRMARADIETLVADRLTLERQLWRAQKFEAVGRLAGGVAHDFNNILAAISTQAHLLRAYPSSPEAPTEAAEIVFASKRAAVLVRRLLAVGGETSEGQQPVVLGDAVTAMQPMLRQLLAIDVAFEQRVEDGRAVIRLADGQLEQVLLNLAVNARDATRSGGTITVSTRREAVLHGSILHRRGIAPGAWAVLEVKDTGVGMDESTRAQAFEPHFTTKAARGGSGLGLATVGGIARAAGGHVFVETAPDAGTTMTVFFPAAAEAAPAAHPEAASPPLGPHAGALLVVDDEPLIRSAVARYLTHLGYRVIEAADVAQAISRGEQHGWHVDLVLTDVIMPDATGPVLAERVRQRRPGMPVLFMTGHLHGASRQSPADIPPVEDTIYKPFDLHTLAERVRVKLAQRR